MSGQAVVADVSRACPEVRKATFLPLILSILTLAVGSMFVWAFSNQFFLSYQSVFGYSSEDGYRVFLKKYMNAVAGLMFLLLAFLLKRLNFIIYASLATIVLTSQVADLSRVLKFEFSENFYERYQEIYHIHLMTVAFSIRLLFLSALVYGAVASFKTLMRCIDE
jgi:hypothetical protein